ncbi:MAG: glycosyltransferase family protein, partial [Planctomycetales bacterium]
MRILYGIFAQGHGHFSKAAVLAPLLESRGHEVRIVSSGADVPPAGYRFAWHRHFPGLSYVLTGGRTDYKRSFLKWARDAPRVL